MYRESSPLSSSNHPEIASARERENNVMRIERWTASTDAARTSSENDMAGLDCLTAPEDEVNIRELSWQDRDTGQKQLDAESDLDIVCNSELPHLTLYLFV